MAGFTNPQDERLDGFTHADLVAALKDTAHPDSKRAWFIFNLRFSSVVMGRLRGYSSDRFGIFEDICQETLLLVYRKIGDHRGETFAELRDWVAQIALNKYKSERIKRMRRGEPHVSLDEEVRSHDDEQVRLIDLLPSRGPSPEEECIGNDQAQKLLRDIRRQIGNGICLDVLDCWLLKGMESPREIGNRLSTTEGAVSVYKNTIRRAARCAQEDRDDDS